MREVEHHSSNIKRSPELEYKVEVGSRGKWQYRQGPTGGGGTCSQGDADADADASGEGLGDGQASVQEHGIDR